MSDEPLSPDDESGKLEQVPLDWRPHDARLTQRIDEAMDRARDAWGDRWGCRAGRNDCCHGPFPINQLDALRLRDGLTALREVDAERSAGIEQRAEQQRRKITPAFAGDVESGDLSDDVDERTAFFEAIETEPCPVLDPATGQCSLYEHRPFTCRTFGPPLRIGAGTLPECPYCFDTVRPDEVEQKRVEPDTEGLEDAILDQLEAEGVSTAETIIAWALTQR